MNRTLLYFIAFLATMALLPAVAQDPGADYRPGPDQGDPSLGAENDPAHGVARISLLNGEVSVRRGDSGDVVAAAMNAPLVTQDRILTSSSSRAEVQFDSANLLRIGSNSEVRLNDVEYTRFQVQLAIGTITFRVRRNSEAGVEIDTPSISFRPLGPGSYRVMVREDGSSEITVREGEAEIFGPRGTERVNYGTTVLAQGSANDPEFQLAAAIGLDDWDRWNAQRDRQLESARSYQYVSPDIAGAEDLEGYGQWTNDPGYGNVWVPRVEPGWAPYRAGRWVWEDFYGWTWVSYDPWGWAPYHYGRWYSGSLGWAWYPGPRFGHHYWSPALVGFFGFGGYGGFRAGVGFGFGNVGWVPLAPFEKFHPWWGRGLYGGFAGRGGREFINNTTIVNNTNITNVYRNARVNNGVTAVGANDFGRHTGQFVGMNGSSIRNAGLVHGVLPVTPDRASLRLGDRSVRAGAFPQGRNVNFAGRSAGTASGTRVPFEQQQRAMDQVARRTFGSGSAGTSVNAQTGGQGWRGSGNAATGTHGWSHFGEPIHGSVADSPRQASPAGQSYSPNGVGYGGRGNYQQNQAGGSTNWHRFGEPSSQTYSAPQSGGRQSYYDSGASRSYQQSAPRSTYQSAPQYSAPRSDYGRSYGGGQAVRINPPMVHERSAPSYGGGGGARSAPSYGGGGGARSAPSYGGGGGARSAPSYGGGGGGARSAPSYGGGGGGNHSNGGGNHSSGPSSSGSHGGRR
ncbi:MAG: DUF6600 domain-containing protein [Bryobacteraceae bacterium]